MSGEPPDDDDSAGDAATPWFLRRGGVSGGTARAVRWDLTPLGPPESWPSTLKTTVATMFRARQPMFLWWGPELVQFYNDGYLPTFGTGTQSRAMGQRGREFWREIWPIIGPQIDDVMERAIGSWNEDALVPILRNGRFEEVYWTYAYSPVFGDDGRVAGTLVICTETTNRVLGERRTSLLHSLVTETSLADDRATLLAKAFAVLGRATADIPFAALYEDAPAGEARAPAALVNGCGEDALERRLARALAAASGGGETLVPLGAGEAKAGESTSKDATLGEAPSARVREVYVMPLAPGAGRATLAFGISPALPFDDAYRRFLEQVRGHLEVAATRVGETVRRGVIEEELRMANRAKDEFLAMLGHELRNPLAPILTALRLMKHKTEGRAAHEQQVIERQVNHLMRLVDDLLDVAKIARGKVELRRDIVDIADVIAKAVEMTGDLLEQRRHQLTITCEKGWLLCDGDPVRLAQVVANLLTNAAKYTNPGGHVAVTAAAADGHIELAVKDDGIGISREMLPRVFTLFEQARRGGEQDGQGGLGIGLALVRNLVSLHGGTVAARSDGLGHGSEFTVRLPLLDATRPTAREVGPARAARPARPSRPTRVLVVDDNVDAAELLTEALQEVGLEVEMATDPLAALDVASRFVPEIAVLDIGLPVIDGYELAARLRAVPRVGACRLIALTGYGQDHDRRRSEEAGFDGHLVKPVDVDRLVRLVESLVAPLPEP